MKKTPEQKSLEEINASVKVPSVYEDSLVRKFIAYSGPGALVAVGYMDPGNWLTSLSGGSQFKYQLLSVLLISILVAMFMQMLSIKLGITTQQDLAQAIASRVSRPVRYVLWILNEIAMMATDMTGVVGTAIALNLLFKIPLIFGVILTIFDVLVVLVFLRFGIKRIEWIVLIGILIVGLIFGIEVFRANPNWTAIWNGVLPTSKVLTNHTMLALSLGIVGATIMPHNLYLHSSLAQSRRYDYNDPKQVTEALHFANWDSNTHLVLALIINALLLILGGTLFYHTKGNLMTFQDVFNGLKDPVLVGHLASPLMSWLFALALLITGLISSISSTLAGQIVMEGYLHIRWPLWKRRLVTRLATLVPIFIICIIFGFNEAIFSNIIVYAQIALSTALPFSLFPLIHLTSQSQVVGEHVNSKLTTIVGYLLVIIITLLNLQLIWVTIA